MNEPNEGDDLPGARIGVTPDGVFYRNEEPDFWQATENWIRAVEARYEGRDTDDLTQVFMRGPFAGMSERQVAELAREWRENGTAYPLH